MKVFPAEPLETDDDCSLNLLFILKVSTVSLKRMATIFFFFLNLVLVEKVCHSVYRFSTVITNLGI